ncbi:hypothetical protein GUITHDRAFT_148805 [Guillardia theta CCMP2712]|uniref:Calmodulin n=1 Tax=Guillardia theta (strain CCMP2712) TaxID=905079 RepID=L1I7U3_GUITC|nr:hypothetical protein GUITHDRAFT_148805 [Guillardia theta CCMP2712]EKX32167.1 hypothetical protein GUITHDRAFT_148805 [Guillardia theta CCMP2712]|eukprot:XP_005819147.1 hypothetical protein GUITHDRAFT_148805 [Guillardia theta CCMP2712]
MSSADLACIPAGQPMSNLERLKSLQAGLSKNLAAVTRTLSGSKQIIEDAETEVVKYFATVPTDELSSKIAFTFKRFDSDQGGFLTSELTRSRNDLARAFAFMGKRVSTEEIEALMDIYDTNRDDHIDSGEFEHMVRVKLKIPCKPDCQTCKKMFSSPSSRPGTSDTSVRSPSVVCKYDCGFTGTVRQVAEHECSCPLAPSSSTSNSKFSSNKTKSSLFNRTPSDPTAMRARRQTVALARRNTKFYHVHDNEGESTIEQRLRKLEQTISSHEISISRTLSTGSSVLENNSMVVFGRLSGLSPEKFAQKVQDLFKSIDVDGSNSLSRYHPTCRSELHSAFARMGHAMSSESLDKWIASCDSDGNGELDMEEFCHIACKVNKYRCPATCPVCKRSPEKDVDDDKAAEEKRRLNYAQLMKEVIEPVCNLAAIYIKAQDADFDFKTIEPFMEIVTFSDGNRISKSGSLTESIIFILRGRVEKRKNNVKLSMHSRGDHFGSQEILEHRPRPHDLIACGACTCSQLKQSHLKRAGVMLKQLVEQLEHTMLDHRPKEAEATSTVSQGGSAIKPIANKIEIVHKKQEAAPGAGGIDSPNTKKDLQDVLSQVGSLLARVPSLKATNASFFGSLSGLSGMEFSAKLREIYDVMDADKSGKIDRNEIQDAFRKMGKEISDETLDSFIEQTDVDGDEQIDLEEFEHLARALYELDCVEGCKVCRMFPTLQREKKAKMRSMIETSSLQTFSTTLMDGWALQDQLKGMIDDSFTRHYSTEATLVDSSSFSSSSSSSSSSSVVRSNSDQSNLRVSSSSDDNKQDEERKEEVAPKLESREERMRRMADELKMESAKMHNRRRNSELHHIEFRNKIDRDINLAKSYEKGAGGSGMTQAQQTTNELLHMFEKAKRLGYVRDGEDVE